jgi:hypothetical protein
MTREGRNDGREGGNDGFVESEVVGVALAPGAVHRGTHHVDSV